MAFDAELARRQLQYVYSQAYMDIIERLARTPDKAMATYERQLAIHLEEVLARLDSQSRRFAERAIPQMYQQAINETTVYWRGQGLQPPALRPGFARVHEQAVKVLAENFYDNMSDAHRFVGRRTKDAWRRIQLDTMLEKVSTARRFDVAHERFMSRVVQDGLGAFRDKAGRIWRLDSYAEMSVRTVTRESTNVGTINQLKGMNRKLVAISSHFGACEICAPLEGRVYSIDGNDTRFPPLSEAFGAFNTVHPNCKHVLVPYVEELDDSPSDTQEKSNRPFDDDPRTQAEKEAYEESQRLSAQRREARREKEEGFAS